MAGGGDLENVVSPEDLSNPKIYYTSCVHNCGTGVRCVSKLHVVNGRIVRVTSDDSDYAFDGSYRNKEQYNDARSLTCPKGRAIKYRAHHPAKLRYALKQTKQRGDLSGFIRIPVDQALKEIAEKYRATVSKYGPGAVHNIYGTSGGYSSQGTYASYGSTRSALTPAGARGGYGDYSYYQYHFGSVIVGHPGSCGAYTKSSNVAWQFPAIAGVVKNVVSWGANMLTTVNSASWSYIRAFEKLKERGCRAWFIGPELTDTGVTCHTDWIQSRNYTDVALIMGMLYEMLVNTFNSNGEVQKSSKALDVDYIDTMVHGFFASPEYWVNTTTGEIVKDKPVDTTNYRHVEAVEAGKCLASYILGGDASLIGNPTYNANSTNYTAKKYHEFVNDMPRVGAVSWTVTKGAETEYQYKKDFSVPKTPEWAEKITGVPKEKIEELAEFYLQCAKDKTPVYNEWAGGQLKQNDGTITLYALQTLLIISKNWGITGTGIANNAIGVSKTADPNEIKASLLRPAAWDDGTIAKMGPHPKISVTQWHNAIKMAFSKELADNGYVPNIPDWVNANGKGKPKYIAGKKGQVYFDDGGVKSLVNRQGITGVGKDNPTTFTVNNVKVTMPDGSEKVVTHEYYNFKENKISTGGTLIDQTDNVTFSGFRFILNSAGNIPMNQHANTIDSARMYKALPTHGYGQYQAEMADAFYLVTFDNFMSPSARYSDYVLPAKTTWEQEDFVTIENSGTLYVDSVIPGPGESKSSWDFVRELIYHYGGKAEAVKFTGLQSNSSFRDVVQKQYNEKVKTNAQSPYYGKTWEEFLEKPITHAKPNTERADMVTNSIRTAYEAKQAMDAFYPNVKTADWSNDSGVFGFGNDLWDTGIHSFAEIESCPKQTGMFQVYSGTLVWRYENLYSKWHGYLPKEKQGQINKDEEGDPIAYPIPVYFNYQDHFRVAYGLDTNDKLNGRYLLTTTHDRFRAHSSQAENPYLRELTHRTIGGALYSGNDSGAYAVSNGDNITFPALNTLIGEDGKPVAGAENRASYADIWVNDSDFADFNDGDLVKVSNEIGAVYCTIRKTARCVPGYVGLHQGCWVDFRGDINNKDSLIDVGGNCNTLMPSTPSRLDHGNGVQSAMVKIERV